MAIGRGERRAQQRIGADRRLAGYQAFTPLAWWVIDIVDSREKIDTLLPHIDEMVAEGLVTLERVRVIKYRAGRGPAV